MIGPVEALAEGRSLPNPPFIPLLGSIVPRLAQVDGQSYRTDPAVQTRALVEVATAAGASAITVGYGTDPSVGVDVVNRIKPMLGQRSVVACLETPDPAAARSYCEAGAHAILLVNPDLGNRRPFRTVANVAGFYGAPTLLVSEGVDDAPGLARELGLSGAIVPHPDGSEPGIVGGGLAVDMSDVASLRPPRTERFFWAFPGEVPVELPAETLASIGRDLS